MYLACGWSWTQERKSKRDSLMEEGLHENSREKFPEQQRQGFLRQNEHEEEKARRRKRVAEILRVFMCTHMEMRSDGYVQPLF